MLSCPGLDLRFAVGPAVTVGSSPVTLLQELLVLALEFVVEDDAADPAAAGSEALLCTKEGAIDLGVVGEFARLSEAGVERLARFPVALQAIRLEQVATPRVRTTTSRSRPSSGTRSTSPDFCRC